jgi:hypothetical protein
MRMRDILQVLKNIASNVTVKLDASGGLPSVELSGKGVLELHANSIWLANVIADGFIKPQIMHLDFKHEFRFVDPAKRGVVCLGALQAAAAAIQQGKALVTAKSAAEFAIVDLLVATECVLVEAAKNVIVNLKDYNDWVISIGGDASEKMSESEHLSSLIDVIKSTRAKTYPMWASLIDLLPDGATKSQAEQKFIQGCKTVGLDSQEVMPNWEISS